MRSCSPRGSRCTSKRASRPTRCCSARSRRRSFASLASTILPWLLSGGTLVLHHPFAPAVFARQRADERCTVAVLPGPMVMRLADAGLIERDGTKPCWRSGARPSGWRRAPPGRGSAALIDIAVFGEIGLIAAAARRGRQAVGAADRPFMAPRGSRRASTCSTVARTPAGTVALSGPMVPQAPRSRPAPSAAARRN